MSCDVDKHEKLAKENYASPRDKSNGANKSAPDGGKATKVDYHTFDKSIGASSHISESNEDSHVDHSHQEDGVKAKNGRRIALRDFFTVLALSTHAIFEGMAIGLEKHPMDIWILFAGNMANNLCIKMALIISSGTLCICILIM